MSSRQAVLQYPDYTTAGINSGEGDGTMPAVLTSYDARKSDDGLTEPLLNGDKAVPIRHGTASRGSAVFNIVCTIAGTGILQLPYTLKQSGWVGISIILLSAFVADYTGKILIKCLNYDAPRRLAGFAGIGEEAFGKVGYYAVQFFQKSTLLGVCTLFLILAGLNLDSMLGDYVPFGDFEWKLICAAVVWFPVAFMKDMKEISLLSLFGMLASMITVVVVLVLALMDYADYKDVVTHDVVVWETFPAAFAAITFSFGGSAVYPEVEHSMAQPEQFHSALSISMILVTLMYLPTAVVGYLVYGNLTVSPILENLPDNWAATVAFAVITAHVILAYPIPLVAVAVEAEPTIKSLAHKTQSSLGSSVLEILFRALYRSVLVALTLIVALYVPSFPDFMTLLGAVCNCALVFVLPVLFNWKLRGFKTQRWYEMLYGIVIVAVGLVGGIIGAIDAIEALINA